MRLVNLSVLRPGEELSYAIKAQDGRILLPAKTLLTYNFIQRLKNFGIASVYVEDDFFAEVEVRPSLSDETKTAALRAVERAYKILGSKALVDSSEFKNASSNIVGDVRKSMLTEPIAMLNLYAVNDDRCLHAVNVATVVAALALEHGCEREITTDYVTAALLHDLHLKNMSEDSDPSHAETTKEYLKKLREFSIRTYMSVGMHHEKYDGTGPGKFQGERIAEGARMIAVGDIYDNLLNGYGSYTAVPLNYAVEQLNNLSGKVLDPTFLSYFNTSVAIYPVGSSVQLNNGMKAIVIAQNDKMPTRPRIKLAMPSKADCIEINLLTNLTVFIDKILS